MKAKSTKREEGGQNPADKLWIRYLNIESQKRKKKYFGIIADVSILLLRKALNLASKRVQHLKL